MLAGIVWMLENPDRGLVEADEMDFRRCLEIQRPYLGPVTGHYTDWTPLAGRGGLFPEDVDTSDPWQFKNVLVRLTFAALTRRDLSARRRACRRPPSQFWTARANAIVAQIVRRTCVSNSWTRRVRRTPTAKVLTAETDSTIALYCPISHVPVAACRSVGSGQEAGQPPTEESFSSLLGVRWDADVIDSRRRNRRTPRSTGDAA